MNEDGGGERVVIVGPGRMGLALGSALLQRDAVSALTYFGRGYHPPPHPLFDSAMDAGPYGGRFDAGGMRGAVGESGAAGAGTAGDTAFDGAGERRAGGDEAEELVVGYRALPAVPPPRTTVLILAVPDDALAEVAFDLTRGSAAPPGCAALHLSGALSTDVLAPLHAAGYAVGSMHPMMAVADPWLAGDRLLGAAFAITGEPAAVAAARRVAFALGGLPLVIAAAQRPLYHAAAVMASNYVVALTGAAVRLLGEAGVEGDDALRALIPLLRGTLDNIEQLGLPASLTGPIARGDADTVRLHLARLSPGDRVLYCGLGLELLRLARVAGLDEQHADEIETLLA
jgi:predicted short-subunit dehydrogenase-like oxidoreductase (DUF2520 family)